MKQAETAPSSVSVVIPAYESQLTARATLESLRKQTFEGFETILIDSGHTSEVAEIAADFPEVRFHRSTRQLLPHEARNLGVKLAYHDILVFTDPDIVAAPDWLEKLLAMHVRVNAAPVSGAVASLQRDWLETGVHLAKFDLWLPGGKSRCVPVGASVNFLCSRQHLEEAGGFDGREMIGDTILSWDLIGQGQKLHFAPDAIVYHDHRSSIRQLVRERFVRGADFARLRTEREDWSSSRTLGILFVTILPLRLGKLILRSLAACIRSGCILDWMRAVPVLATGHAAWLCGEITQYWRRLQLRWTAREAKPACT